VNDELEQQDEQQDDQFKYDDYPMMEVTIDPGILSNAGNAAVFPALLALDVEQVCVAIIANRTSDQDEEDDPSITVRIGENGKLEMRVNTSDVWLHVEMDPTKFNRTNPKHEKLLQCCAAIVKAIHELPITEDTRNPRFFPFEFEKWPEDDHEDTAPARWAKLAEVWATAVK
jgi:hypothetical protein